MVRSCTATRRAWTTCRSPRARGDPCLSSTTPALESRRQPVASAAGSGESGGDTPSPCRPGDPVEGHLAPLLRHRFGMLRQECDRRTPRRRGAGLPVPGGRRSGVPRARIGVVRGVTSRAAKPDHVVQAVFWTGGRTTNPTTCPKSPVAASEPGRRCAPPELATSRYNNATHIHPRLMIILLTSAVRPSLECAVTGRLIPFRRPLLARWRQTMRLFHPIRRILCAGVLVLAGAFSNMPVAVAQAGDACLLPAGMTPPAPPRVTAQQVEDGSASLMEFALAATDRHISLIDEIGTLEGASYIQCRVREEGSPWRSGSTYLVFLTPDGRVFEHAKAMALSGRLLKPEIYGAILHALGIDPAHLANPAAAGAAFAAAATGNGGSFNVPNVPGASGYAVFYAANPQVPRVLLAGFDIDESHVAEEEIDFGDPDITAAEVVDRETLKAFVTESIEYISSILETGGSGRHLESQDRLAGSERAVETWFRLSLRIGTYHQHHHVPRRLSGQIRVSSAGADCQRCRYRKARPAAGSRSRGKQPGRGLPGVSLRRSH